MKHLAILTFDLVGAESSDYERLNEALKEMNFLNSIHAIHLNRTSSLPSNTYTSEFEYEGRTLGSITVDITELVKKAFVECKVKGEFFIQVTDSYNWTKGAVK